MKKRETIINKVKDSVAGAYKTIRYAMMCYQREGASRGAAGMAYYTLFSLFPLLIVMVTIGSYFVDDGQTSKRVAQLVIGILPVSQNLVERNIERIQTVRNSVCFLGLVGLLSSGSNAFSMMVHHITNAWPETERRSFFEKRLFGLAMVIVLILVLFVMTLSSTLLNAILRFKETIPGLDLLFNSGMWAVGTRVVNWAVPFLLFYSLYRIIPNGKVPIKAAGISALVITIIWRAASNLFQVYLGSDFARYEVIFGSLSAIVILLLWIYISSVILFFGAHLCAASAGKVPRLSETE